METIKQHAPEASKSSPNGRDRFLAACNCLPLNRPPIWLMRQAGRALPEYRALKVKHSFLEMVHTPELAAEVTLQPLRRFNFDAAILFSDILIVSEALGQKFEFKEEGGIRMEFILDSPEAFSRLDPSAVATRLKYVGDALKLIKPALKGAHALIGFAGSPWTLANFMIEGAGRAEYTHAKNLFHSNSPRFEKLMKILTVAITDLLNLQIEAGADAVQIFDSFGGLLSDCDFENASGQWIKKIINGLKKRVPIIVFAKGVHSNWDHLARSGATVLGVDWNARLGEVARRLPSGIAVQGNLDPFLLTTTPEIVARETSRILREMKDRPGHIFNLGHGVPPTSKLENIERLVGTVRNWDSTTAPGPG